VFEPGTRWEYGTNIDWTGRLVEAVSGETLEAYFQRNILQPLGMNDTAEFAVESIRRWWKLAGRKRKQGAKRILICADAGGSNSSRSRTWKLHLQELADELGMAITVCHYPPGTSKWNKIEHRLFSFISLTWKGQPLINYETVVNLIGATKTRSGLRVKAVLDTNEYETGVKVTKSQMAELCIRRHKTHPDWNYTLEPRT